MAFLAVAAPYLAAAGAAVSAVGAVQQGQAAKKAANYNAAVQRQNAEIATSDAALRARQIDRTNILRSGQIRAAHGASGGASDQGSVLDVLGDVATQGELEKQDALYKGDLAARGYSNTASLDSVAGDNAAASGYMKAGGELLSGAARYYQFDALKRTN